MKTRWMGACACVLLAASTGCGGGEGGGSADAGPAADGGGAVSDGGADAGPADTVTLSGRVIDRSSGEAAVAGATVEVVGAGASTTTGADGAYELRVAAGATVFVRASAAGYAPLQQGLAAPASGTARLDLEPIRSTDVAQVVAALGLTLEAARGAVLVRFTGVAEAGGFGAAVGAEHGAPFAFAAQGAPVPSAATLAGGGDEVVFPNTVPGTTGVTVAAPAGASCAAAQPIDAWRVDPGVFTRVSFACTDSRTTITGRVYTDPDGTHVPVAGATVEIAGATPPNATRSGADGSYRLRAAPGSAFVRVRAAGYQAWQEAVAVPAGGTTLDLTPVASAEVAPVLTSLGIALDPAKGVLVTRFEGTNRAGGFGATLGAAHGASFAFQQGGDAALAPFTFAGAEPTLVFPNVGAGTTTLSPSAPGAAICTPIPGLVDWRVDAGVFTFVRLECNGGPAAPIAVTGLVLAQGASEPLAGAAVQAIGVAAANRTTTAADGSYTLYVAPNQNTLFVRASASGRRALQEGLAVQGAGATLDFTLAPATQAPEDAAALGLALDPARGWVLVRFAGSPLYEGLAATLSAPHDGPYTRDGFVPTEVPSTPPGSRALVFPNVAGATTVAPLVPAGVSCALRQPIAEWRVDAGVMTAVDVDCTDARVALAGWVGDEGVRVAGAVVELLEATPPQSVRSGADGSFSIRVAPGTRFLRASAPGHLPAQTGRVVPAAGAQVVLRPIPEGQLAQLTATLGVVPDAGKGVFVVHYDGTNNAGGYSATLSAAHGQAFTLRAGGAPVFWSTTLPGGEPVLVYLDTAPGTTTVTAVPAGAATCALYDAITDWPVDAGVFTIAELRCEGGPTGPTTLTGRVHDSSGGGDVPVAGATVEIAGANPPNATLTAADGTYTLYLAPGGGTVFVRATKAGFQPIQEGRVVPAAGAQLELGLISAAEVAQVAAALGTPFPADKATVLVRFEGSPLYAGYGATLSAAHGAAFTFDATDGPVLSNTTLAGGDDLVFLGVQPGTTTVTPLLPAGAACTPDVAISDWRVDAGVFSRVGFRCTDARVPVTGLVMDGISMAAIAGATVEAVGTSPRQATKTAANGTCALRLAPGTYFLRASAPGLSPSQRAVAVGAGGANFEIHPVPATTIAQLLGAIGQTPDAGKGIVALHFDGTNQSGGYGATLGAAHGASFTMDATGTPHLSERTLPRGDVSLVFPNTVAGTTTVTPLPPGSATCQPTVARTDWRVDAGVVTEIDYQCSGGPSGPILVTGKIFSDAGGPAQAIAGATVTLVGAVPAVTTVSGADGSYSLPVMPGTASVFVRAAAAGFQTTQEGVPVSGGGAALDLHLPTAADVAEAYAQISFAPAPDKGLLFVRFEGDPLYEGLGVNVGAAHGATFTSGPRGIVYAQTTQAGGDNVLLVPDTASGATTLAAVAPVGVTCTPQRALPAWRADPGVFTRVTFLCTDTRALLHGVVQVDSGSDGAVVADATVEIAGASPPHAARTGTDGSYQLALAPGATVFVRASAASFQAVQQAVTVAAGGTEATLRVIRSSDVALVAGALNLTLDPARGLLMVGFSSSGPGASGYRANVTAAHDPPFTFNAQGMPVLSDATLAGGDQGLNFPNTTAGSTAVTATAPGGAACTATPALASWRVDAGVFTRVQFTCP